MSEAVEGTADSDGRVRTTARCARAYVVSDKMDKTVVVEVEDRSSTALYGKIIRRTSKLKAHDEPNSGRRRRPGPADGDPAHVGDQALAGRRDPREGQVVRRVRLTGECSDSAGVATAGRRQHRGQGDLVHPGDRRLGPALRRDRRHHRRHRQGRPARRRREEGRRRQGRRRAHRQRAAPPRRLLHPLRRERRRSDPRTTATRAGPASSARSAASCATSDSCGSSRWLRRCL